MVVHIRDKREKLENVQDLEKKINNDKLPYQSNERVGQHQSSKESQLSKPASHMAMQGRVSTRVVARPGVVLTSEGVGGEGTLEEGQSPED